MDNLFYYDDLEAGKRATKRFARYQQFLKETGLPHTYATAKAWSEYYAELMMDG